MATGMKFGVAGKLLGMAAIGALCMGIAGGAHAMKGGPKPKRETCAGLTPRSHATKLMASMKVPAPYRTDALNFMDLLQKPVYTTREHLLHGVGIFSVRRCTLDIDTRQQLVSLATTLPGDADRDVRYTRIHLPGCGPTRWASILVDKANASTRIEFVDKDGKPAHSQKPIPSFTVW